MKKETRWLWMILILLLLMSAGCARTNGAGEHQAVVESWVEQEKDNSQPNQETLQEHTV